MKKLLIILAMAAAAVLSTGCDIDADLEGNRGKLVIGNIYVDPDDWHEYTIDGYFDHLYADIYMPEITDNIFHNGVFYTYWVYNDQEVEVQENLGATIYLERYEDGQWLRYEETIRCSYSVGNMRIELGRDDFSRGRPDKRLHFRTVILW